MAVGTAANSNSFKVTTPSDCEITLTRLFDAPRVGGHVETRARQAMVGSARRQALDAVCEIDFRVGGAWHFVGRGPRGEYGFHGEYREIVPPERVVFTEIYDPFPDDGSLVTSVLTEEAGKTRLTVTARYRTRDVRDFVINTGMEKGAAISYDRLEDLVIELQRSSTD